MEHRSDIRTLWDTIDYGTVRVLYDRRYGIHRRLATTFQDGEVRRYAELALGIEEDGGNYSAAEHGLGPRILQRSRPEEVFALATKLFACEIPAEIPEIIYATNLPYLKIGVGSEMAALLRPDVFWVTNVRTIWAHLVIKHDNNVGLANEELYYYRTREMPSEMEYSLWRDIHPLVGSSMEKLAELGNKLALKQGARAGSLRFLWADAIADTAYNKYSK